MKDTRSDMVIGVLGGMGTYASIYLFQQYAEVFPAVREWERPRIIIDNYCTMPSRVRALLYGENNQALIACMCHSIKNLINAGCSKIIIGCNTAHVFLPHVLEQVPEAEDYIVNIIDCCILHLVKKEIKKVYLLASEGTISSNYYQGRLASADIECIVPKIEDYGLLRECIETVKQNRPIDLCSDILIDLLEGKENVILGCTELPIIFGQLKTISSSLTIFDPVKIALMELRDEWNQSKEGSNNIRCI